MRGFEYTSIEDEQKKLEAWRDVAISGALIITTIFCPPLGIAASVIYGGLQVKSAIEGEDWGTHRKLSKEEQVEAGFFGALDIIPGLGSAAKAFKGTIDLGSLAKLTKWKEGIADFNPNIGKNVVQSLKDNETLKNALHTWKKTKVPVAIRSADTGMGIKIPHIEHATVGEIAKNFARVRATAKEDAYQLAKGNGDSGVKGTGETTVKRQTPNQRKSEVIQNNFVKITSRTNIYNPKDIPSVRDGEFIRWFDNITLDELEIAWANPEVKKVISSRLRSPGKLHEWLMIARAPTFKRWGISAKQIQELRTPTKDVEFINPPGKHHRAPGSKRAHNEILEIIDTSLDYDTFVRRLQMWFHYRYKGGVEGLPGTLKK